GPDPSLRRRHNRERRGARLAHGVLRARRTFVDEAHVGADAVLAVRGRGRMELLDRGFGCLVRGEGRRGEREEKDGPQGLSWLSKCRRIKVLTRGVTSDG